METLEKKYTLKAIRVNSGLSQTEAAKKLGISQQTLSSWENGTTFPLVPDVYKIEELYKTPFAEIKFML